MSKAVQLSTRVTAEDAAFLGRLQINGAHTPSDKLRTLIASARRRENAQADFGSSLALLNDILGPVIQTYVQAEHESKSRSELVHFLGQWLTETTAFYLSGTHRGASNERDNERANAPGLADLQRLEVGLAERVVVLVEAVLRMGVVAQAPCYDKSLLEARLGPALQLAEVIRNRIVKP